MDPWGQESDAEFADLTWQAQRSGLTVTQVEYYRSIGADVVWTKDKNGDITFHHVPATGDVFVDRPITVDRETAGPLAAAMRETSAAAQGSVFIATVIGYAPELPSNSLVVWLKSHFPVSPIAGLLTNGVPIPITARGAIISGMLYHFTGTWQFGPFLFSVNGPLFNFPDWSGAYFLTVVLQTGPYRRM